MAFYKIRRAMAVMSFSYAFIHFTLPVVSAIHPAYIETDFWSMIARIGTNMKLPVLISIGMLSLIFSISSMAGTVEEIRFPEVTQRIGPEEWAEMKAVAEENLERLRAESKLPPVDESVRVTFEWPLRPTVNFYDFSYWVISDYVDHDPRPDNLLDYECGDRVYDGHNGTDYVLWPFPWYKMDHDEVEIVAAAAGVIFDKADGYYDHSCTPGGASNKVAILHADGTRAWYLHMKTLSLTSKGIGETVAQGEYLGMVGSSGNSGLPHLHFDVRDANWNTFDPYAGPCNPLVPESRWADQRPYYDSEILAVLTHSAGPEFPECPKQEIRNIKDQFAPGETVYIGIYHRDLLAGQLVEYSILRPDETVAHSDSYGISDPHYTACYALRDYLLPETAPEGTWQVVVDYEGNQYTHPFLVAEGGSLAAGSIPDGDEVPGTPLRIEKTATDEIMLTWGASCFASDIDYEVYSGPLEGSSDAHRPVACTTGGETTLTFLPAAGNRYYLVVPTNGEAEGSYGKDSGGLERPRVAGACLKQYNSDCF
jgi:hypothetical protein